MNIPCGTQEHDVCKGEQPPLLLNWPLQTFPESKHIELLLFFKFYRHKCWKWTSSKERDNWDILKIDFLASKVNNNKSINSRRGMICIMCHEKDLHKFRMMDISNSDCILIRIWRVQLYIRSAIKLSRDSCVGCCDEPKMRMFDFRQRMYLSITPSVAVK